MDRREKLRQVDMLLRSAPHLEPAFQRAKHVVRIFRKSAFYEISRKCNLFCEGCYFFSDGFDARVGDDRDLAEWRSFFRKEGDRGVSMGYFVGAEPSLQQDRLLAASEYIPYGNIGTNGTIRIHSDVPYRIQISIWGDDLTDAKLRGTNAFRKALRNYAGDSRAILLYTFNSKNIHNVRDAVLLCRDNGLRITFSNFSPTLEYESKLKSHAATDNKFFRVSSADDNIKLAGASLREVRMAADAMIDEFPDTVLFTKEYSAHATREGSLYDIDPTTGIAEDCRSRIRGNLSYFGTDLQPAEVKCCTSGVDCSQCRLYSGGWSGFLEPGERHLADIAGFAEWIKQVHMIGEIFVNRRSGDTGFSAFVGAGAATVKDGELMRGHE